MDNRKIQNNKGFTLIEMIVVIAIMAILTATAAVSINVVNNANASKAARRFEAMLNNSRMTSITKGTEAGKVIISKENGKLYGQIGENGEKELICNSGVKVYFNTYSSVIDYNNRIMTAEIPDNQKHIIKFQTNGAAKDMSTDTETDDNFCKMIFSNGNRNLEVVLYRQTGKHEVKLF